MNFSKIIYAIIISMLFSCSFYKESEDGQKETVDYNWCVVYDFDLSQTDTLANFEYSLDINSDLYSGYTIVELNDNIIDTNLLNLYFSVENSDIDLTFHILKPALELKTISSGVFNIAGLAETACKSSCVNNLYYSGFIDSLDYGSGSFEISEDTSGNTVININMAFDNANSSLLNSLTISGTLTETQKCPEDSDVL
ncbi:MAG: hypothetical protein OEZ13_05895 [Spirochaetia bacterium]|nr:hypothetical protein [Spirochaetia bacterium]